MVGQERCRRSGLRIVVSGEPWFSLASRLEALAHAPPAGSRRQFRLSCLVDGSGLIRALAVVADRSAATGCPARGQARRLAWKLAEGQLSLRTRCGRRSAGCPEWNDGGLSVCHASGTLVGSSLQELWVDMAALASGEPAAVQASLPPSEQRRHVHRDGSSRFVEVSSQIACDRMDGVRQAVVSRVGPS